MLPITSYKVPELSERRNENADGPGHEDAHAQAVEALGRKWDGDRSLGFRRDVSRAAGAPDLAKFSFFHQLPEAKPSLIA